MKFNYDNTWISSDFHYGQKNIIRSLSTWNNKSNCRDFASQQEHDSALVANINEAVPERGNLIFLGDWSFGGIQNIWNFRKRINCKNIYYIFGNHDHHIIENKVLPNAYQGVEERRGENSRIVYTVGNPEKITEEKTNFPARAQHLFKSCAYYMEIQIEGQRICMSHYSMRVWNKSHKGAWMLYGHSHGNLPEYEYDGKLFKTMDVGIDTHPEFKPYSLREVKAIMDKRETLTGLDHH